MPESSQYKQEPRTLGPGNLQASPGDHTHDGTTSKGPVEFAPAWTCVSVNPVIGNGTLFGKYVLLGGLVHLKIQVTMGTTTTYGTGGWRFALPVLPDTGFWTMTGLAYDSSAVAWESVQTAYLGSGLLQVKTLTSVGASMAELSSSVPFIWATGDVLTIQGTYGY